MKEYTIKEDLQVYFEQFEVGTKKTAQDWLEWGIHPEALEIKEKVLDAKEFLDSIYYQTPELFYRDQVGVVMEKYLKYKQNVR